jgi:hypothetical protein
MKRAFHVDVIIPGALQGQLPQKRPIPHALKPNKGTIVGLL